MPAFGRPCRVPLCVRKPRAQLSPIPLGDLSILHVQTEGDTNDGALALIAKYRKMLGIQDVVDMFRWFVLSALIISEGTTA